MSSLSAVILHPTPSELSACASLPPVGRFAPSPTGRMHLGNVYAALLSWLSVRVRGGRWLLRVEDIDRERSRRCWEDWIMDDLSWLGLGWDGPVWRQSERDGVYEAALGRLAAMGVVYPCRCSRAEIMASQAPHESDGRVVYPGRCRPRVRPALATLDGETLRLMTPPLWPALPQCREAACGDVQTFRDALAGEVSVRLSVHCGDFVVRRRDGAWAYQLAVSVDDAAAGVTEVVRGADLLLSTAQQRYVQSLLGLGRPSRYVHLPLLTDAAGRRLSKRDAGLAMDALRASHSRTDVLAMVARAAGLDADEVVALVDGRS